MAQSKSGVGAVVPVIAVAVLALGAVGAIIVMTSSHGSKTTNTLVTTTARARPRAGTTTTTLPDVDGITAATAMSADLTLGDLPGGWIEQVLPPPAKVAKAADGDTCSPVFGRSVVYDVRSGQYGNGAIAVMTEGADSEVTVMSTASDATAALQALDGPGYAKACIQRSLDLGIDASLGPQSQGTTGPTAGATGGPGLTGLTGQAGSGPLSACTPKLVSSITPVPAGYLGVPATQYDYRASVRCPQLGITTPALQVDWVAFASGHAFVDAEFYGLGKVVPAAAVRTAVLAMVHRAEAHGI